MGEFMDLIFNTDDNLNVDLKNVPEPTEKEEKEV